MAAPKFQPLSSAEGSDITSYQSPDHVPDAWVADRPGEIAGRQPAGSHLGYQGPDQGYALTLAARLKPDLVLSAVERADDAIAGCVAIALRRASVYGRAPVIHDVRIALTIWGYLDPAPPAELVEMRVARFEGVGQPHHYDEVRSIADAVPESTLRSTPAEVLGAYPAQWRTLLGV